MHIWQRLWRMVKGRAARQSWGLAPDGPGWVLLGLSRQGADLCRVQAMASLRPPTGLPLIDAAWLAQALTEAPRPRGGSRHRLAMSWPDRELVEGHMDCPADLPADAWPAEVQLEVAQALNLPPEEVHFDFAHQVRVAGAVPQLHWVGCARAPVADHQRWIRASQVWRLGCVEPEIHAAQRAARALRGGLPSLLQQAPQDWQFHLGAVSDHDLQGAPHGQDQEAWLREALASPAGPRLVASGLALKGWA